MTAPVLDALPSGPPVRPEPRPPVRPPDAPGAAPRSRHRPEIQALRALAVLLVVAFHVAPDAVPGGYIGVDVFFVISGYLITGGLVRELTATGSVGVLAFWARRVRRLLPAALLVIAACAVAVPLLVPVAAWGPMLDELRASALYVENRQLAASAVDYFAAGDAPSPVRHFWSLSVEEQFYLVWPLLLLAVGALVRVRRPRLQRRAVVAVVGLVTAASFVWALTQVATDPAAAYYGTAARAWEFGAGALLAAVPLRGRAWPRGRALLAWVGVAAIVVAAFAYGPGTPFPGVAGLLPVLGAVALIAAGLPTRWGLGGLMGRRPVQRLGDLSYGVYLWHWPLLVLGPFVIGGELGVWGSSAAVVATLALAWLTERFVEAPIRRGWLARRRAGVTFAGGLVAMGVVLAMLANGEHRLDQQVHAAQERTEATLAGRPACFGAAARDPERPCSNPRLARAVVPAPVEVRGSANAPCGVVERDGRLSVCAFGAPRPAAAGTVAVVGDSHAAHWRGTVEGVAEAQGWHGVSMTYTSCPFSTAVRAVDVPARARCAQFREQVFSYLRRHPEVHTVFVAALSGGTGVVPRRGQSAFAAAAAGYADAWRRLPASVRHVVVLRDNPKAGKGAADCIQRALNKRLRVDLACAVARRDALDPDPEVEAARAVGAPRVQVADLTERFCDRDRCFPVVGGALVHRDQHHLAPLFARTLAPALQRALARLPYSVSPLS